MNNVDLDVVDWLSINPILHAVYSCSDACHLLLPVHCTITTKSAGRSSLKDSCRRHFRFTNIGLIDYFTYGHFMRRNYTNNSRERTICRLFLFFRASSPRTYYLFQHFLQLQFRPDQSCLTCLQPSEIVKL